MRYVAGCFVVSAVVTVHAQSAAPAFDVASIKPNHSASVNSSSRPVGGRYTVTNSTVVQMLRNAFGIQEFQIAGGPGWMGIDRFDIDARVPAGSGPANWQPMLQTLLVERFKLAFHREQRQAPIYSLVVAKGGPTLTPADPSKCQNAAGCGFNASTTRIDGTSVSMDQLAARLSRSIGVPVVDHTGLSGLFDVTLEWTIEDQFVARGASASPTIFPAIQQQLGLRLESARGPVDTLVVDRLEQPTED
jgi:uncharacterized protein (TIGR03435 family)